jgi:hypothetical protein
MIQQVFADLDRRQQAGEFDVKKANVERSPAPAGPIQIATFDC